LFSFATNRQDFLQSSFLRTNDNITGTGNGYKNESEIYLNNETFFLLRNQQM